MCEAVSRSSGYVLLAPSRRHNGRRPAARGMTSPRGADWHQRWREPRSSATAEHSGHSPARRYPPERIFQGDGPGPRVLELREGALQDVADRMLACPFPGSGAGSRGPPLSRPRPAGSRRQ